MMVRLGQKAYSARITMGLLLTGAPSLRRCCSVRSRIASAMLAPDCKHAVKFKVCGAKNAAPYSSSSSSIAPVTESSTLRAVSQGSGLSTSTD